MSIAEQIKQAKEALKSLQSQIVSRTIGKLTVKIGEKGTVNVYGLGRFPVCLYLSQAQKLAALFESPEFKEFLIENQSKLAVKSAE